MAIALVSSVASQATSGVPNTTSSIDTTGATLLVASLGSYSGSPTISDSKGNTWTLLTAVTSAGGVLYQVLAYVENPTVGSGHTFTPTGGNLYQGLAVAAWSGVAVSSALDQQNSATTGGSTANTLATGSITPTTDNQLVVVGMNNDDPLATMSIDSGFSIAVDAPYIFAGSEGSCLAYLIQTSAAAANPTWTHGGSNTYMGSRIASFKESGGGGATGQPTMSRWNSTPFIGQSFQGPRSGSRMWGRHASGLVVPQRLAA